MSTMSKLIVGFVALIVGIVLIVPLATQSNLVTEKTSVNDEAGSIAATVVSSYYVNGSVNQTVTNAPTNWKTQDCPLTSFVMANGSNHTWTLNTDYIVELSTGTYFILNTTDTANMSITDNATQISYVYCGDDYLNSSWGRTASDTAIGFFALAVMLAGVALFYSVAKDYGLIAGF